MNVGTDSFDDSQLEVLVPNGADKSVLTENSCGERQAGCHARTPVGFFFAMAFGSRRVHSVFDGFVVACLSGAWMRIPLVSRCLRMALLKTIQSGSDSSDDWSDKTGKAMSTMRLALLSASWASPTLRG